ncbi:MAG: hypothetical protein ACOCZK_02530 [Planctomycetota bacterium]
MNSNDVMSTLESRMEELRKEIRKLKGSRLQSLREGAANATHKVTDGVRHGISESQETIARRPLAFTSSAFGLGLLAGGLVTWLLTRE